MFELDRVRKTYDGQTVLDGVSFTVPEGSTHALIGSSGSGKTTLLRIALGLIPMDNGSVRIDGQEIHSCSSQQWANRIGYVPQEGGLFPHLNARRNISLVAELRGWKRDRIEARLEELRSVTSLDRSLLDKFPAELSGGQKQRIAIIRAVFLDPSVMLLDEPLGALDPLLRRSLQEELKTIFQRLNKTVLLVTHDLGEAVFFAEQITLLRHGRVIQTGTYEDLVFYPKDAFVETFIQAQRTLPVLIPPRSFQRLEA